MKLQWGSRANERGEAVARQATSGTQDSSSDTLSSLDSTLMWDDSQAEICTTSGQAERRDSMARSMPSAARLTEHAFDNDTNNCSSDSSAATSGFGSDKMTKMIYSKLDSFSDTTSENDGSDCANNDADNGAISDGSNSIARPEAYPPD